MTEPVPVRTPRPRGDLRVALIEAGTSMLEAGETFSWRAVARRVGVSQTAPYRHFADREHLEAAMAARGFRALHADLEQAAAAGADEPLIDLAIAHVRYAVANPALYRLMFAQPCGDVDERLQASADLFVLLKRVVADAHQDVDAHSLATAAWAMAHGLASLWLDGKLTVDSTELDAEVRAAFTAILAARRTARRP